MPAKQTAKLSTRRLNGDQLALGTRLTAGNQPLVVEHLGRARWTLEPHATALVTDAGEFLTVKLESGALSAAVVPNPKPETFAVEVEGTRVAVHGTAFRVERVAERVQVEVSEGTVAVEAERHAILRPHFCCAAIHAATSRSTDARAASKATRRPWWPMAAVGRTAPSGSKRSGRRLPRMRTVPAPAVQPAKPDVSAEPAAAPRSRCRCNRRFRISKAASAPRSS